MRSIRTREKEKNINISAEEGIPRLHFFTSRRKQSSLGKKGQNNKRLQDLARKRAFKRAGLRPEVHGRGTEPKVAELERQWPGWHNLSAADDDHDRGLDIALRAPGLVGRQRSKVTEGFRSVGSESSFSKRTTAGGCGAELVHELEAST